MHADPLIQKKKTKKKKTAGTSDVQREFKSHNFQCNEMKLLLDKCVRACDLEFEKCMTSSSKMNAHPASTVFPGICGEHQRLRLK